MAIFRDFTVHFVIKMPCMYLFLDTFALVGPIQTVKIKSDKITRCLHTSWKNQHLISYKVMKCVVTLFSSQKCTEAIFRKIKTFAKWKRETEELDMWFAYPG